MYMSKTSRRLPGTSAKIFVTKSAAEREADMARVSFRGKKREKKIQTGK